MIKKVSAYLTLALIIAMALFFRLHNLEGKMTFEWDQARDFETVSHMLTTGKPLLLGPIVRGATGGFYLGPLYYYLITPLYFFSGGNPLSLTILSIGLDVVVIWLLFVFIKSRLSLPPAVLVAILWSGSPFIINNSYIPWNVSLIPLWSLLFIIALTKLLESGRFRDKWLVIFLASLTTNIHLSLIPIAAITLLINWRLFTRLSLKKYLLLALAAILPVSTLIVHDLRSHFTNLLFFKKFLFEVPQKSTSLIGMIPVVLQKYGYTVGRLFTGEPYTLLGLAIVVILVGYGYLFARKNPAVKNSLLAIVVILVLLLIYRDPNFAEYYFMPTFIPLLIIMSYLWQAIFTQVPRIFTYLIVLSFSAVYLSLGLWVRSAKISPYSLTVKKALVTAVKNLGYPVEFRTNLPRERNTGFDYLMKQIGVTSTPSARRKAYVYEVKNMEIIAPEDARSIILNQPIEAFKLIVFSN